MIYKTFEVALELKQTSTNPIFTVVEGDTGNRLKISVTDGGSPVDLRDCRILAVFSKTNGIAVQDSGGEGNTGIDIGGTYHNEVTVSIFPASIAPGNVECELQIYSGNNNEVLITTARFNFECNRAVMNGDVLQSTEEFPLLVNLISTVQSFVGAEAEREAAEAVRQAEYQKWANAEAVAESIASNASATAEITEIDGKQVFKFGIPKGRDGEGNGDMEKAVYDANNNGIVDKAEDAQKLGGKLPEEYQPKGNYASPALPQTVTLTAARWDADALTQTVTVTGVTATNIKVVAPNEANVDEYATCGVKATGEGQGTVTFTCTTVPEVDLLVNIAILG